METFRSQGCFEAPRCRRVRSPVHPPSATCHGVRVDRLGSRHRDSLGAMGGDGFHPTGAGGLLRGRSLHRPHGLGFREERGQRLGRGGPSTGRRPGGTSCRFRTNRECFRGSPSGLRLLDPSDLQHRPLPNWPHVVREPGRGGHRPPRLFTLRRPGHRPDGLVRRPPGMAGFERNAPQVRGVDVLPED